MEVNAKRLISQLQALRNELASRCPNISEKYDFALDIAIAVIEGAEEGE